MGIVYLAEQDEPVHREVALKVLRAGESTHEIVARFESERQALALMEHPNITRVYDAGATEDGLPYFVMERVSGAPITEYAAERRLTIRERVRLIVQVCRAAQHAHQKGIIHRDIKPSNVLVMESDGEPVCKIIDFGIAKATAPIPGWGRKLTGTGMVIGTPAYMSPEQFESSGVDIDTRSDIYSIGVLLYELLAGVPPFGPAKSGRRSLLGADATGDVPAPSAQYGSLEQTKRKVLADERRTDPDGLRRMIAGDLDCIILKALENDRDHRYATANAMAADIERYLADEPVAARAATRTYRAQKFARRHRTGVAFTAAVLVMLLLVAIGASVQARRLSVQAHLLAVANETARARQGQAEDLIEFMLGSLHERLSPIGKLDLLDDAGRKALAYFAAVPESALSDEEQFRRARALQQLGHVRLDQGKLPEAAALAQRSIALMLPLAAKDSLNARWQLGLAHNQFWAGQIDMRRGNVDAALTRFEPLVRVSDRLIARFPDSLSYRAEVAYSLNNIGFVREAKGDAAAALASYRTAIAILTPLVRADTVTDWKIALAAVHNASGVAQRKLGDLRGSLNEHQQELAIKQSLANTDSTNRQWQRLVAIAHTYLSDIRLWTGDVDGASSDMQAAQLISAALVAHDSTNVSWEIALASSRRRSGQLRLERNDGAGALRELDVARDVLARTARMAPANVSNASYGRETVAVGTARGRALTRLGRTAESRRILDEVLALGEAGLSKRPSDLDFRRVVADAYIARAEVPAETGGVTAPLARALVLVDSIARSTKETEFLVLQAKALLRLSGPAEAQPMVTELLRRGYRRPSFMELLRAKGVSQSHLGSVVTSHVTF